MDESRILSKSGPLALAVLFGAVAVGCGSPGTGADESVNRQTPNAVVCSEGETLDDRELYVLSAMRKKLLDFPELAAEVGSDPPTDCAGARQFYAGYLRYSELYPDFDANQALGPAPSEPPRVVGPGPELTVKKLAGGQPPGSLFSGYPRTSVVKLVPLESPNTGSRNLGCSGVFIAKNWIVTAAHCLSVTRPQEIPETSKVADDLFGYARWRIDWPDANGDDVPTARLTAQSEDILQHPDPRYIGRNPSGIDPGFTKFDFALLYLREEAYDTALPPRAETGAAMRVSIVPPQANADISAAGYGTGTTALGSLETAVFAAPFVIIPDRGTIEKMLTSATEPALCKGDSGGPAYQIVNVGAVMQPAEVPFEQAPTTVPVMVGVNSAGLPDPFCNPPNPNCPLPSNCGLPGETMVWSRVDQQRLFIEERMGLWQMGPLFQCREGRPTGATTNSFIEFWGTPCEIDKNCAADEYCKRPSDAFANASCQVCQGSCSCIVGQCIKGPPPP